jgi:uncharacterized ion transporter superfamily protein YfcC
LEAEALLVTRMLILRRLLSRFLIKIWGIMWAGWFASESVGGSFIQMRWWSVM